MEEIAEITELSADDEQLIRTNDEIKDEIEIGLEIVALEMGHILEELKDNLERLSWVKMTEVNNEANKISTEVTKEIYSREKKKVFHSKSIDQQKVLAAIGDKYQQQPTRHHNRHSSIISVKPKQQTVKPHKSIKADTHVEKTIHNEGPQMQTPRINNKPCYKVQQTNYRANCNKLTNLHSHIFPAHIGNNQKIIKLRARSRSSGSSTSSNPGQHSTKKSSVQSAISTIKKQSSFGNKPSVIDETLKKIKAQVDYAIHEKKTFTVCGNYYTIRRALISRGWVEKIRILYNTFDRENLKKLQACSIQELVQGVADPKNSYIYKRMIMSKLLGQHQVDFYWDQNFDCFRVCRDSIKLTTLNRFRRGIFNYTSKQGLCESMKRAYWYQFPGVANVRHPRSYNLANSEDPKHFINDFKLSAAMALLKWIVKQQGNYRYNKIITNTGRVPLRIYHFAVSELSKAVRRCKHEDIDYDIEDALDYQWNEFLESFYKIVHIGERFKNDTKETVLNITEGAKNILAKIESYWPHLNMDGMMNIWILKPTNGSRGEGIYLCRTLQYVLKIIKSNTTRRYIVQKYIERPLLIYNTKFDIRQWFLISNAAPLTIWIYKECYVRFSSQLFTLHRLHESIHLTNNSIQSRYKNCTNRNTGLPVHNMWDAAQFKKYLAGIGHPKVFADVIYPGMRECLTGAILMNQGNIDTRKNCFELYGSDFMLTEDFKPWLIEINSRPALYPSTPITARMCPQVLDDLIKVIIDHPRNSKASTGRFELLYKEDIHKLPKLEADALQLKGDKLPTSYFYTPHSSAENKHSLPPSTIKEDCMHHSIHEISSEMKKTLENLLSLIQSERRRRTQLRNKSSQIPQANIQIKNCQQETDINYPKYMEAETCDEVTLKVIKSVASNLKTAASSMSNVLATKSKQHAELGSISSKPNLNTNESDTDDGDKKNLLVKAEESKGLLKDIINSLRNISFAYRSTQI